MGRLFAVMLMLMLVLVGCTQPQALSTAPRATGSLFVNRTATAIPSVATMTVRATTPAHNPFATQTQTGLQAGDTASVPTTISVATAEVTRPVPTALTTNTPSFTNTPTAAVIVIPRSATPISNEQRWRIQQRDREVLSPVQIYTIQGQAALLWYDPLASQVIEIGLVHGSVPVQARFNYLPYQAAAIEIPYRINVDFGLTSISDAAVERMRQAGYTESVESFIIITDSIRPQN